MSTVRAPSVAQNPSDQAESSAAAQKRLKRRVAPANRQRTENSCDRCRKRKVRCIRLVEGEDCAACNQAGLACETTIPRKQRIYSSEDQLPLRYKVMEAIMRSDYPEEDLESLEGLKRLARDVGVEVDMGENGTIPPINSFDTTPIQPIASDPNSNNSIPLALPTLSQILELCKVPEGALVPAPKGGYHYVGPASLAVFAQSARDLVQKCRFSTAPTFDDVGLRRFLKAAEFTTFRTSQAIEARIEGHPATAAAEKAQAEPETEQNAMSFAFNEGHPGSTHSAISPTSPHRSNPSFQTMSDFLPNRSLSDSLVSAFFDRVHPNFTVFHRGTFQMQYESLWATTLVSSPLGIGWTCALSMIYVLGAQAMENVLGLEAGNLQQRYAGVVIREGLHRLALTASLVNVQALMLLALYQHNAGERNTAWMLLGQALRTAVALGMNRDGQNENFDPFERNARRTVWWELFKFEQNVSFALGRPSAYNFLDTSAALPDEIYLDGNNYPTGYFESSVKLADICNVVKRFTASVASYYRDPHHMRTTVLQALQIISHLVIWRSSLPTHLSSTHHLATPRHRRSVNLLHIHCDHLQSVVARSYLLCRVNAELDFSLQGEEITLDPGISDLASKAVDSAHRVADGLMSLSAMGLLEGSVWLDYYYAHHAAFVISLHLLSRPVDRSEEDHQHGRVISTLLRVAKQSKLAPTYRILMNVALQLACIVGIGPDDNAEIGLGEEDGLKLLASLPLTRIPPASTTNQSLPFPSSFDEPSTHDHFAQSQSYNTLETFFGPMAPSQHNSPPDLFADLYNFGLDTNAENPWDLFNIGVTAEGLMQGLRNLEGNQSQNQGQDQ